MFSLVEEVYAHDGPIRSICIGPFGEVITGNQGDAPCFRRWRIDENSSCFGEVGEAVFHDHWVTALTALRPGNSMQFPDGCIISGCMDTRIRVFSSAGILIGQGDGHAKGVISFSWSTSGKLISGSWDGTAKVWELISGGSGGQTVSLKCLFTLDGHENGVSVLGISRERVITASTGEAVNGKPANFKLRVWDAATGQMCQAARQDHAGPIRSIAKVGGIEDGYVSCSNDGSVMLHAGDGEVLGTMWHPSQADGTPPFVLFCTSLESSSSGLETISCGDDGSVMVWRGTEPLQTLSHPKTVWCAVELPGCRGDAFVTGSHDGILRRFSRDPAVLQAAGEAALRLQQAMEAQVAEEAARKVSGPSADEIAKATKWEHRGSVVGKSDGHVMVFNKDGRLIAAQWLEDSRAWIEVGEVTGSGDGGSIHGVHYDHVMPVEFEVPGGVRQLQLGYNNLESPFDAAQRFLEENGLGQQYLRQVADWIVSRSGAKQAPTLDMRSGSGSNGVNHSDATGVSSAPVFVYIPLEAIITFDDMTFIGKVFPKMAEFNVAVDQESPGSRLSPSEMEAVDSVITVIRNTSYYHSSTVPASSIHALVKMISWPASMSFPAFDLLRLVALHPDGSNTLAVAEVAVQVFQKAAEALTVAAAACKGSGATASPLSLCAIRFISNSQRRPELRRALMQFLSQAQNRFNAEHIFGSLSSLWKTTAKSESSSEKLLRVALSSLVANLSVSVTARDFPVVLPVLPLALQMMQFSLANAEAAPPSEVDNIFRLVLAIGTVLQQKQSQQPQQQRGAPTNSELSAALQQAIIYADNRASEAIRQCALEALRLL